MTNENESEDHKPYDDDNSIRISNRLVTAVFAIALGSGPASNWVSDKVNPPRPDLFTGKDADHLEQDIKLWVREYIAGRCDGVDVRCDQLERRVDRVEDFMFDNHRTP